MLLILSSVPFVAQAEDGLSIQDQELEEQIVEMVVNRSYPGGMDEDDLAVQPELTSVAPHLTAATLQWRTLNAINRRNASEKKPQNSNEE